MNRIIIHGCSGKMGKTLIEIVETADSAVIAAGVDPEGIEHAKFPVYKKLSEVKEEADVVIDFSVPEALQGMLDAAVDKHIPVVVATTGLEKEHEKIIKDCSSKIAVFQAANMSLGINLLKELIKQSASVLGDGFDIEIIEKHHRTKRDAPSGTALVLAEVLKQVHNDPVEYIYGRKNKNKLRRNEEIGIHAVRAGNIVGEHDVMFAGKDEVLSLKHTAYSKGLFAIGALKAAAYIIPKRAGLYTMESMIAESSTITNLYTRDEALIAFNRIPASLGTSHNIFEAFSAAGINIDMISQTITEEGYHSLSFSIDNADRNRADMVLETLQNDTDGKLYGSLFTDLCKLTVEGIGMETQSGVASAVFGILVEQNVESMAVSTSETKISVIIEKTNSTGVIHAVKQRYKLK